MGVHKLSAQDLVNYQKAPRDLSDFWKNYFANLSITISKLLFKYTRENISVRYLHRNVINASAYFATTTPNSVIKPFKITPHDAIGFFYLTNDLCNHLIDSLLGGGENNPTENHIITNTDQRILETILKDLTVILEKQMQEDGREISFQDIDPKNVSLFTNSTAAQQDISVQQFVVFSGGRTFVFDIAFTNRILEEYLLL